MRLLVVTVLTAVVVTGCTSAQSTANGGSGGTGTTSASAAGPTVGGVSGGGSSSPSATPSNSDSGSAVDARCLPLQLDDTEYNGKQAKPVPDGIAVDWVLRCRLTPQPDGSRILFVERSDSDPAALLAALRAADEPPNSGGVCLTMRVLLPYFALVQQDGKAWVPKIPLTHCRQPQAAVLKALAGLRFEVLSRKRLP
jgi:hypothetical protein